MASALRALDAVSVACAARARKSSTVISMPVPRSTMSSVGDMLHTSSKRSRTAVISAALQ
jgi:hypothetical protein